MFQPQASIDNLRRKVARKVRYLQGRYPWAKASYRSLRDEMLALGVTPETTYLYIQGHHMFDTVVAPILSKVCNRLRMERENEINRTSVHNTQMRNEISCYENSIENIGSMLKKKVWATWPARSSRGCRPTWSATSPRAMPGRMAASPTAAGTPQGGDAQGGRPAALRQM